MCLYSEKKKLLLKKKQWKTFFSVFQAMKIKERSEEKIQKSIFSSQKGSPKTKKK